jgi:hypothetical protein
VVLVFKPPIHPPLVGILDPTMGVQKAEMGGALGVAARGRPDAGALPAGRVLPWI